jgi:hypothetical protein
MEGVRCSLDECLATQEKQSTNHWVVPSLYQGVLHSMTSTALSKAIRSDTIEEDVITEGLHKILTIKLSLYRLTAEEECAYVT